MTATTSPSGRRKVDGSLLTEFVDIFESKKSGEKLQIFVLNMEEFLRGVLGADTVALQPVLAVTKVRAESQRSRKYATHFAAIDHSLLRKAGTKQVRQTLRASMAVQNYAVCETRVAHWLFTLFCEKGFSSLFLSGSAFLRGAPTEEKAAARTSLPHFVAVTTKTFPHSHGPEYANSCLHDRSIHLKPH